MKTRDFEYTIGNKKIPKNTMIFNMGPATKCPADKLGLCGLGMSGNKKCYALKAERGISKKTVATFRLRQQKYWLSHTKEQINKDIDVTLYANPEITTIRVNESGDMHGPDCLKKLIHIAKNNPNYKFYTYTHRSDIMKDVTTSKLPKNLSINLSYTSKKKGFNSFIVVSKDDKRVNCVADCRHCHLCKDATGKKIYTAIH